MRSSPGDPEPRRASPSRDPAPSPAQVHPPDPGSAQKGRRGPTHLGRGRSRPGSSCRKCEAERRHVGAVLPEAAEGRAGAVLGAERGRCQGRGGARGPVLLCRLRSPALCASAARELPEARRRAPPRSVVVSVSCAQPGSRSGASVPAAEPCASRAARKQSSTYKLNIYRIPTQC